MCLFFLSCSYFFNVEYALLRLFANTLENQYIAYSRVYEGANCRSLNLGSAVTLGAMASTGTVVGRPNMGGFVVAVVVTICSGGLGFVVAVVICLTGGFFFALLDSLKLLWNQGLL